MGLEENRRLELRIKIRNVLLRHSKRLSVERADWMADAILDEVGREPFGTLEECPTPNCACWMCVLRLHSEVAYHQAQLQVAREAELEVD